MIRFFLVLSLTTGIVACKETPGKTNLLPGLEKSDSAVVMYYHEAGNPRFFNFAKVYSPDLIRLLAEAVNKKTITGREACVTQGKIYLYGARGAVETIYFSRADSCRTLSFIKTGEKYFTSMPKEVRDSLDAVEKRVVVMAGRDTTGGQ
jgi:hypothetical protein